MNSPSDIDHNKLIAAAAKEALSPLGLKRHGKSRIWYDDHGWWCIVVEFQPSAWSRGTYLNVGVSWLLFEKAHWTFDVGHREQGFSPAKAPQQFADALAQIVEHASQRIRDYRQRFGTIQQAHDYYQTVEMWSPWDYYHAGVVAVLAGDVSAASNRLQALLAQPREYSWQEGLYYRALDLSRLLENRGQFLESVAGIVHRTRSQLLLDLLRTKNLGLPNDVA